ncbi:unnamed protein product, partial [Prorocentrum cordatum]
RKGDEEENRSRVVVSQTMKDAGTTRPQLECLPLRARGKDWKAREGGGGGIRGGGGGPPTPARPAQTAARTPPPGNGGASSATAGVPVAAAPAPSPMTSTTAPAGTPEAAANASSLAAAACGVPPAIPLRQGGGGLQRRPRCPHGELPRQRRPQLRALRSWAASWPQRTAAQ